MATTRQLGVLLAIGMVLALCGPAWGATMFSTDFSGAGVPANLEESQSPMTPPVTYGGQATWANDSARSYLRTIDTDYTTGDFTAEVNITTQSGAADWGVGWFGLAKAEEGSYQEPGPTNVRHLIVIGNDAGWQAGNITLRSGLGNPDGIGSIGMGTHRLRLIHQADAGGPGTMQFQVDKNHAGPTFTADWTSPVYDVSAMGLDTTNSRVMFGGGRGIVYDDFAITSAPPPTPAVVTSRLGTWAYEGYAGATGYMSSLFTERGTQFGLHLRGESVIDSFTIDQTDHSNRHRIQDITVYASPTESYSFTLTDSQAPQTFSLPNVQTSHLLMTVDSRYTAGSSDYNMGIDALSLTGTEIAPDVNLNAGILPTAVGLLSGYSPARATDGTVHDGGTNQWTNNTTTFFTRNGGKDSLTVNYAQPTSINTIGLGLDAQRIAGLGTSGGPLRDRPKFIVLEYDGGSQQVDLWGDKFQYARYTLSTPITDTSFLRVVFPDGSIAGDWYLNGDANYGITEFQAFNVETAIIPEPVTMGAIALALAGLGGYVRKRKQS